MRNIKIGIFGACRGMDFAKNFMLLGCDIVAVCDFRKKHCDEAVKKLGNTATA